MFGNRDVGGGDVEIGVVEDDGRVLAAELQRYLFQMLAGEFANGDTVKVEVGDDGELVLERGLAHTGAFQSLNDKYKNKAKVLLHFSDVHTIGQLVKSNIGITLMTDFLPFQDMDGLVKIPLVAEDKVPFYVQYAYLKNAVLDEKLQELIAMLDRLSKEDELV